MSKFQASMYTWLLRSELERMFASYVLYAPPLFQVAIDLRGGVSGATVTLLVRVVVDASQLILSADPAGRLTVVLPPGGATNVHLTITNTGNVPSG